MSNISQVISWKWDDMPGMSTKGNTITAFPAGVPGVNYDPNGIPTQADQDQWTEEYKLPAEQELQLNAVQTETVEFTDTGYAKTIQTVNYVFNISVAVLESMRRDEHADADKMYTLDAFNVDDQVYTVLEFDKAQFKTMYKEITQYWTTHEDVQRGKRKDIYKMDYWDLHVPTDASRGFPPNLVGDFIPSGTNYTDFSKLTASGLVPSDPAQWDIAEEHLVLADGSFAHWDGVMWMSGKVPI